VSTIRAVRTALQGRSARERRRALGDVRLLHEGHGAGRGGRALPRRAL